MRSLFQITDTQLTALLHYAAVTFSITQKGFMVHFMPTGMYDQPMKNTAEVL